MILFTIGRRITFLSHERNSALFPLYFFALLLNKSAKLFFSVLFIDIYRHSIWNLFTYLHIYKEKIMCILCHWNLSYIIGLFTQISEAFGKFRSIDSSNSLPTISKSSKLFSCSFSFLL